MYAERCFVHCLTVHTNAENHHKEVLSSKSLVHFLPGSDSCRASLYISKMSPGAVLLLCLKNCSHLIFLSFASLSPPLPGLPGSTRPQNGSMILYNRKKVKYRKDGYCWKKRKDGKTTREDHMKLKVQGVEVSALTRVWI